MSKLSPENNFPRNTFSQEIQSQINTDEELSKIPIKKIKLLDSIACKSKLTEKDIDALDHEIKSDLIKKYQKV